MKTAQKSPNSKARTPASTAEIAVKEAIAGEWRIASLEMDASGRELGEHFQNFLGMGISRFCLSNSLHVNSTIASEIKRRLGYADKKTLAVYSSGFFHHYTYGLCKLADKLSKEYFYIHFDHHSDYSTIHSDYLACGGFVGEILRDTNAQSAFFVGSLPLASNNTRANFIQKSGRGKKIDSLDEVLEKTPEDVYISFDLDVMADNEILTDFDRGTLKTDGLLNMISAIKQKKRIISADILGYDRHSRVQHSTPEKSKLLYVNIAGAVLSSDILGNSEKKDI